MQPAASQRILQRLYDGYLAKLQTILPPNRQRQQRRPGASQSQFAEDSSIPPHERYERRFGDKSWEAGLHQLLQLCSSDPLAAADALPVVFEALGEQTQYPVLLAIDDFQALYGPSHHKDPRFRNIESCHLSIPRTILEFAGGMKTLRRGALLGALSLSDTTFRLPLVLREALKIPWDKFEGPYARRNAEYKDYYCQGLQTINLPDQMTVDEASGIFEMWSKDKALHSPMSDRTFLGAYSHSSGNPREFVWKGLLSALPSY